jgi:hypothetical protein
MNRPPSTDTGDGCAEQSNNECPVEDVGERRHQDSNKGFPRFQLAGSDVPTSTGSVFVWFL